MDVTEPLNEAKELVLKLAVIAERVDRRNGESARHVEQGAQALDAAALRLQGGADQFADTVIRAVAHKLHAAVAERSAAALDEFSAQLLASTGHMQWAAETMTEQRKLLSAVQRTLVWKGLAALLIGSVLAATGSSYLLWQARQAMTGSALAADVRAALQSGALARCRGDQLCARTVTARAAGKSAPDKYVLIR